MKTGIKEAPLPSVLIAALGLMLAGPVTAQTFTVLHTFSGGSDGAKPVAGLILSSNALYGTASVGGNSGNGTVFKVSTDGTGFTNLHSFTTKSASGLTNNDGAYPKAELILSGDALYGTAEIGGASGNGTVFKVNTDGTGFGNLHSFTNSDGNGPLAGLILSGNTLHGSAGWGGSWGWGTLFSVNTDGTGFTNLHNFTGGSDGAYPFAELILSDNKLYGTAYEGGGSGNGTVFAVNSDGTGFTNLYSFTARVFPLYNNSDGAYPNAGLILSRNTLYGTAAYGGSWGYGTVFALNIDGTGFTNLHSFKWSDGSTPTAGLVLSGRTLYGTTSLGGSSANGTVFAINTDGTGFSNLHGFAAGHPVGPPGGSTYTNSDGANPHSRLLLFGNTLFGTASRGGISGVGTVFSLSLGLSLPTITCGTPLTLECTNGAAVGTINAEVEDTNGNPLRVVWTVDGTASQTNEIPSAGNTTTSDVTFTANFGLGEHVVVVSASNSQTDPVTCSTTVTVHDTTPPQITRIAATPNMLWSPNHRMIPVNLTADALDNCDPSPVVRITNVTSNEPQNPFAPDWEITGAQSLNLRTERSGKGEGRIYTIVVECKDMSGNVSTASVDVTVPHD